MTRGGGEDRRMAGPEKVKVGVKGGKLGELAHSLCRDMVLAATRGWVGGAAVNRERMAALIGVSLGVLNRMMSPGDELAFRADHLMILIAAEEVVPEEARFAAGAAIAAECGGVFVPLAGGRAGSCNAHPSVNAAVLSLAQWAGRVAELVRAASCEGGVCQAMTRERRGEIDSAALEVERAAGEVMGAARAVR